MKLTDGEDKTSKGVRNHECFYTALEEKRKSPRYKPFKGTLKQKQDFTVKKKQICNNTYYTISIWDVSSLLSDTFR